MRDLDDFPKFPKSKRGTFRYWYWHWRAFNRVAKDLGIWKFKYIFHDLEKPFLRLFLPYKIVQKIHRSHNKHHLEYPGQKDWEAMYIDWECSQYTKETCPRNAIDEAELLYLNDGMDKEDYIDFMTTALKIRSQHEKR